jgi:hypothetical protein
MRLRIAWTLVEILAKLRSSYRVHILCGSLGSLVGPRAFEVSASIFQAARDLRSLRNPFALLLLAATFSEG